MFQWLESDRTDLLFWYSSWVIVCMAIFMIFMLTPWFPQIEALPRAEFLLRVLGGTLGVIGAAASLVMWFGMTFFLIFRDDSSTSAKLWWFVLFLATAMFGSVIYFFTVYRKRIGHVAHHFHF